MSSPSRNNSSPKSHSFLMRGQDVAISSPNRIFSRHNSNNNNNTHQSKAQAKPKYIHSKLRQQQFGKSYTHRRRKLIHNQQVHHMITHPWLTPISSMHLASTKIQSLIRRFIIFKIILPSNLNTNWRDRYNPQPRTTNVALKKFLSQLPGGASNPTAANSYPHYCSTRIGAWYRMARCKSKYKYLRFPIYSIAALMIQNVWRACNQQKYMNQQSTYLLSEVS